MKDFKICCNAPTELKNSQLFSKFYSGGPEISKRTEPFYVFYFSIINY